MDKDSQKNTPPRASAPPSSDDSATPDDSLLTPGTPEPAMVGAETKGLDLPTPLEEVVAIVPTEAARLQLLATAGVGYRIVTFTVFLIAGLVLFAYGLYRLTHVLELFIIGLLLAMALNPTVTWLAKRGVRRIISVSALLLLIAGGIGAGVSSLAPALVDQSTEFVRNEPQYRRKLQNYVNQLERRFPNLEVSEVTQRVSDELASSLSSIQGAATKIFTASVTTLFELVLVVFIVVFVLVDPQPLVRGLRGLMPPHWQSEVQRIGELAVGKVEAWIQGSLILMLTIAVADTVGLVVLGIPYALLWGVLSGLLEIVPTLGPIISAIPPTLVALTISPSKAIWVLGMYTAIQQLESNILVPLIMANKVRLHPVTLLFFLLMMAEFLGIFGALIATPLAAILKVLYMELYYRRIHGSLPNDEADDPIRMRIIRRFARRHSLGKPPGPPTAGAEAAE